MNIRRISVGYRLTLFSALLLPLFLWISGCGESSPTTPDVALDISDVAVSITGDTAQIQWTTDVPADSQIEYGTTESYGMSSSNAPLVIQHRVELSGLQPQTTYHFRVLSSDEAGQEAQSRNFTFVTLAEGESTPQPSEIEVSTGTANVTIVWQTNESTKAEVDYGEDTSYGLTAKSSKMQLQHRVQLTGLKPDTTYHYRVKLTDLDGNVSTSSDFTFKTEAAAETGGENTVRMTITAKQWEFSPRTIRVKKGDKVILTLRSADVPHGFGLGTFGVNQPINPGKDVVVEFTANKKGSHTFVCTVQCGNGHGNMQGTLIVE